MNEREKYIAWSNTVKLELLKMVINSKEVKEPEIL